MACLQSCSFLARDAPASSSLASSASTVFASPSSSLPHPYSLPSSRNLASKLTTKCALSDDEKHSSSSAAIGRGLVAGVVATGAALAVFANMSMAAIGPGGDGARRTAEKADELLKAADKLNMDDAPPRFGPGRPGPVQDASKISQIAGSGPLATAKKGVTDATKGTSDVARMAKNKGSGLFGMGKKQSGAVAENATDAFSQAKGKTEEVVSNVKQAITRDGLGRFRNPVKDIASNVGDGISNAVGQTQGKKGQLGNAAQNAVSQAQGKKNEIGATARDAIGQADTKTYIGNDLGKAEGGALKPFQQGLQNLKESAERTGADARSTVADVVSKNTP